ncbi:hypothetical protein [Hymenobacter sp. GOD-10R]|uniref:hypothetical protein n=1 Tax=Hymenobacter sp. GOD-10R TaxID=3093922 RepID=UPI002D771EAC|nr:hypothetical protein [Hymenobacter sp. GOD-10R]WRQ31581.1 hypothetical protein SD425_28200 [Hymenobacter sp. GOD-10R]
MRTAFDAFLGQLYPTGGHQVLIDQRRLGPFSAADTSWFLLDWLLRAVLSACQALARVNTHATRQEDHAAVPSRLPHL